MKQESTGTYRGAVAVFTTAFILWPPVCIGLWTMCDNLNRWTDINYDAAIPIVVVLSAAIAGFASGLIIGNKTIPLQMLKGWMILGVLASAYCLLLSMMDVPQTILLFAVAVPALGSIVAVQGARMRSGTPSLAGTGYVSITGRMRRHGPVVRRA